MESQDLRNKVIVITGASSGFGKGAARRFAQGGTRLVLAARRNLLLGELAQECQSLGSEAIAIPTDVSNQTDMQKLSESALSAFGRIDVWINNAGVGAIGRFEEVPLADHVQVIETNLLGTLYGTYFAYQQFLKQGAGVLINISSELGKNAVPYYASYAAAKHGVTGLDDSLRQEVKQNNLDNIHICTILPTAHDTPFFDHAANYTGHEVQPPKPLHDPEKVIETIVRMAANPKDETIVGGDGPLKVLMSNVMPGMAEKAGAKMMHKTQYEKAPLANNSPGAVRAPIEKGTEVSVGRRYIH